VFEVNFEMIMGYAVLVIWVVAVSWLCLRFLEGLKLSALGFALYTGWFRDVLKGCVTAALMMSSVVLAQVLGGGTRLGFNPIWRGERGFDLAGFRVAVMEIVIALVLLILAAAMEELWYRGYAFQTLLRGAPAIIPIVLFSFFFGLAHWKNPSRTFFSTANTVLAGIWLSIAYLRTRGMWFPTALHFTWNWTMGAVFGIPVSGLRIPEHSILVSTNVGPVWLTGGSYGSEGGAAATVALIIAIIVIWRARWLRVSPEMSDAWRLDGDRLSILDP
jgi:membrane protease YdiL (CAAX protease family)